MGVFGQLFGGADQQRGGGGLPIMMAVVGAIAYRTIKNYGGLSEMLGLAGGDPAQQNPGAIQADTVSSGLLSGASGMAAGGLGGLTGLLSQVSGGNAGITISKGLQHLLDGFRQNGLGDKAESWVSNGQNKPVSPGEVEQGMGSDMVNWLTGETGIQKEQLLAGLAKYLPEAIDKLTPNGKLPTPQEAQRRVNQLNRH